MVLAKRHALHLILLIERARHGVHVDVAAQQDGNEFALNKTEGHALPFLLNSCTPAAQRRKRMRNGMVNRISVALAAMQRDRLGAYLHVPHLKRLKTVATCGYAWAPDGLKP